MARDIGSSFEKMTRKVPGERRLDDGVDRGGPDDVENTDDIDRSDHHRGESGGSETPASSPKPPASSRPGRSGGAIGEIFNDVVARGRRAAGKATEKARSVTTHERRRRSEPAPDRPRRLSSEGVVTIEYSPQIDGDPDPGEVVWVWVPFEEDPEQGKDRPVIVIGRRGSKLVGVPLTTKPSDREAQIAIGTGDWDPRRRRSYARIWRMLDFDEHGARREGSVLPRGRFDEVIAAVDEYYEVRRPVASSRSSRGADEDDDS